jgi:hypothetical protein
LPAEATDLMQTSFVPIVPDTADTPVLTNGLQETAPKSERSSKAAAATSIEIKLAGAVVRVTNGTETALLADVLRAIRASAA